MKHNRLIATIGLPGSGKTTRAKKWLTGQEGRARVNRDELRFMMWGGWTGNRKHEKTVTIAQYAAIKALLIASYDVIVDDTNLNPLTIDDLTDIATECGVHLEIWDMTYVPVDVCIERDARRGATGGRYVGEEVIRRLADRWLGEPT